MTSQDLRDNLFKALRGNALPGLKELDDLVLADIDKIMPIVEAHYKPKPELQFMDDALAEHLAKMALINARFHC